MKKITVFIACFTIIFLATSGFVDKRHEAAFDSNLPSYVIFDNQNSLALENLKGKWTILSFWASFDADSRMAQNSAASFIKTLNDAKQSPNIQLVSVNFDRSAALMREIERIDNLIPSNINVSDPTIEQQLRKDFRMQSGLRTFLINPEGKIVKCDPTTADLQSIIG